MSPMDASKIRIMYPVGEGGFGKVYLACNDGKYVVVKAVRKKPSNPFNEMMVRQEYSAGMKLRHPNLVRVRGSYENVEDFCLVMDPVYGENLFDHMEHRDWEPLPENRARKMFQGLAKGLKYAHSRGYAHLDIKPDNIMVDNTDKLTLIDFGLAMDARFMCSHFRGTPEYSSPEKSVRLPFEPKAADVWSMGIVLFIMLTGKMPFGSASPFDTRESLTQAWRRSGVQVSDCAKQLVQWMLELQPSDRPTVAEILGHRWMRRPSRLRRLSQSLRRSI